MRQVSFENLLNGTSDAVSIKPLRTVSGKPVSILGALTAPRPAVRDIPTASQLQFNSPILSKPMPVETTPEVRTPAPASVVAQPVTEKPVSIFLYVGIAIAGIVLFMIFKNKKR